MNVLIWTLSACVLILAVLLIRALFGRKLRPGFRYALWALVLVRLLIPGSLWTSPVSVGSAASGTRLARDLTVLEDVESLALAPDGSLTGTLRESGPFPARPAPSGDAPDRGTAPGVPAADSGEKQRVTIAENVTPRDFTRMSRTLTARRAARIVWIAGSAAVLAVFIVTNVSLYTRLGRRRRRLEADCPVRVYEVEGLESSCLFLNAIYVNSETAADGQKLRHVLAHELSHRRHGDGLWALLRCAALTVHWFDPLVWIAASASRQDSELFADAGALRRLGDGERESYGSTLISLSVHVPRAVSPLCAATAMSGGKKALRARVELIARSPRATLAVLLAAALIAGIAVGCTFAGTVSEGEDLPGQEDGAAADDIPDAGTPDDTGAGGLDPEASSGNAGTPDDTGAGGETASGGTGTNTQIPLDPDHYFYTGDGWTMEAPRNLGGDPLSVTVTTGDGGNYWYLFSSPDGSALRVYRDRYSSAGERYDFMTSDDGTTGDAQSLTVTYTDENGSPREERYIDCPDGGHWEIAITSPRYMDELREMSSSFRVTPGTEPVIESDTVLRLLFANARLENMTIARVENGVAMPAVSAAGSPHGAEYLEILRSLRWADDLGSYEGKEPAWCVILETPDFRIVLNDVGWAGVTTSSVSFPAWIVNYEDLSYETGLFGWEQLSGWYDEAALLDSVVSDSEAEQIRDTVEDYPDLSALSYPDLFGLYDRTDGAYAELYLDELISRFLREPAAFLSALAEQPQKARSFLTDNLGADMSSWYPQEARECFDGLAGESLDARQTELLDAVTSAFEAERIRDTVEDYLRSFSTESMLYTDQDLRANTVLDGGCDTQSLPNGDDTSFMLPGGVLTVAQMRKNITFYEDKAEYWKGARQMENIYRRDMRLEYRFDEITVNADTAHVQVSEYASFTYTDSTAPSYAETVYTVDLVKIGDGWWIADINDVYDWFDARFKNTDFDVQAELDALRAQLEAE